MDQNELREHLAKLRAQLSDAGHSDAMQDIHGTIDEPAGAVSAHDSSLPERLEKIAVQFEADHPTLAASARRLVDLLGEVGI